MKKEKKKKYALVLSGGGFNGAFQLGAINYINDHWEKITGLKSKMKFDLIAGVSVGAINGSVIATNQLGLLNDLWLEKIAKNGASEIYTSDFIDTSDTGDDLKMKLDFEAIRKRLVPEFNLDLGFLDKLRLVFSKKKRRAILGKTFKQFTDSLKVNLPNFQAIADNTPLKLKLNQYLDRSKIRDTKFMCGFVSLDNGQYKSVLHSDFSSNDDFINGVLSSACIPMVYEPVKKVSFRQQNDLAVSFNNIDGGVNNVSPLGDVIKYINTDSGSDYKIIIINCHSGSNIPKDFSKKNVAQIATRALYEIAFTEIFNNDIKHYLKINDLVKQAKSWYNDIALFDSGSTLLKEFETIVIQPDKNIDLGNGLVANEKLINLRAHHGELMAQRAVKFK